MIRVWWSSGFGRGCCWEDWQDARGLRRTSTGEKSPAGDTWMPSLLGWEMGPQSHPEGDSIHVSPDPFSPSFTREQPEQNHPHVYLTSSLHPPLPQLPPMQFQRPVACGKDELSPKRQGSPLPQQLPSPASSIASIKPPAMAAPGLFCGCQHIIKIYGALSITEGKETAGEPLPGHSRSLRVTDATVPEGCWWGGTNPIHL